MFFVDERHGCIGIRYSYSAIEDSNLDEFVNDSVIFWFGYFGWDGLFHNYPDHIIEANQMCDAFNRSLARWDITCRSYIG